ncbi:MAG: hypothetical protein WCG23_07665 [bacterium]
MINHRKKMLTKMLAMMIAGLFGLESVATAASLPIKIVPLRGISTVTAGSESKKLINPDSSSIKLKGGIKIDNKEQLVTLCLSKSDLRQVLRMLADKAKKNIIIDSSVGGSTSTAGALGTVPSGMNTTTAGSVSGGQDSEGEISLDLVNVTVNKAFEYIMTIKQLSYWQDGNTLIVATNAKASELGLNKTEIKPIKIKYVDAQKVADFLNSNIFSLNKPDISKAAIVTSNPSSNEIYIFGKNSDYELAKKVIAHLDTKPQVNTFTVNYAAPTTLASKICMTVFQNTNAATTGSSSVAASSSTSGSTSGSQLTTVCSGSASGSGSTSGSGTTSSSGSSSSSSSSTSSGSSSGGQNLSPFSTSSYMVLADPGLNQITIFGGTQEQVNLAQEIIKNFDKKEPQVYLEISIIELSEDGSKILSTEWINSAGTDSLGFSAKTLGTPATPGVAGIPATATTPFVPGQAGVPGLSGQSGALTLINPSGANLAFPKARDFSTVITSIITNGKGRILSNPRMIASNNEQSTININEDIVASIKTDTTTSTATTSTTTIIPGKVGISLTFTPKISPNGYVTFDLKPSYSSVKGDDGYGGTLTRSRDFEAKNLSIKDGETLVIAGLIQESETNAQSKAPILADLPVVGVLFKNQSTTKSRSELIFMITPRIIKDDKVESI